MVDSWVWSEILVFFCTISSFGGLSCEPFHLALFACMIVAHCCLVLVLHDTLDVFEIFLVFGVRVNVIGAVLVSVVRIHEGAVR